MLTICNFSFCKSPKIRLNRQIIKGRTAISPSSTFNLIVGFSFSVPSSSEEEGLGEEVEPSLMVKRDGVILEKTLYFKERRI